MSAKPLNSQAHRGTEETEVSYVNGVLALLVILAAMTFIGYSMISPWFRQSGTFFSLGIGILLEIVFLVCLTGLTIIQPNTSVVCTLFGTYMGTLSDNGFFWVNPLMSGKVVSTKTQNMVTPVMKVNDGKGNPIEIAAIVVLKIAYPAKATFDVENALSFVQQQCESALRGLAASHPYEADDEKAHSLRGHSDEVSADLLKQIQERVFFAGVQIIEARISHLAYAPEIAQSMLRRQQAEAVVSARTRLVEGAVGMVELALNQIQEKNIVKMSDNEKSRLVTNMMTVLLSEAGASPVVSVGSATE